MLIQLIHGFRGEKKMKKIITICVLALLIVPVLTVTATENEVLESEIQTISAVRRPTPQSIDSDDVLESEIQTISTVREPTPMSLTMKNDGEVPTLVNTGQAPNTPVIAGPTSITIGERYEYTITTVDPQGDGIHYKITWGDCPVIYIEGPYESGEEVTFSHTWTDFYCKSGKFTIGVKATDIDDYESNYATLEVYVEEGNRQPLMANDNGESSITNTASQAPSIPSITGPTSGIIGKRYGYKIASVDPQGDDVYYKISWGDGAIIYWDGPHKSGEEVTFEHAWCEVCGSRGGDFTIQVWVKDVNDNMGDCKAFEVGMVRGSHRSLISSSFLQFLESFMERFPLLENLLGF